MILSWHRERCVTLNGLPPAAPEASVNLSSRKWPRGLQQVRLTDTECHRCTWWVCWICGAPSRCLCCRSGFGQQSCVDSLE